VLITLSVKKLAASAPCPSRITDKLLAHHRLDPIGADQRHAAKPPAVLVEHRHAGIVLLDALDPGAGEKLHPSGVLRALEQGKMHVRTVDHGIGVAKALAKFLIRCDLAHLVAVERIVHDHEVGEYRTAARLLTDAQSVKCMKGVRAPTGCRRRFHQSAELARTPEPGSPDGQGPKRRQYHRCHRRPPALALSFQT